METKTAKAYNIDIFIAGDIKEIERVCSEYCLTGFCVSVTPTSFVYTYGKETGARIGLINYARFPMGFGELYNHASALAEKLMDGCYQRSCSIVTPGNTIYLYRDE